MAAARTRSEGKTSFVKQVLFDNPNATRSTVNEAWRKAGMTGSISSSLVGKLRAELGLTGRPSKTNASLSAATAKADTRPHATRKTEKMAKAVSRKPSGSAKPPKTSRSRLLEEIETDIDHVIFKLIGLEGLSHLEDALRRVRRELVLRGQD